MTQELNVADLELHSSNFDHHGRIPELHTDDGKNLSPSLGWSGVPEGTRSFAVVVHDPDAPLVEGFTHWVLYNIPGDVRNLNEDDDSFSAGRNSAGTEVFAGPAPPPGHGPHHYYFWIYALDTEEQLPPSLDRHGLLDRIEDHVIEQARLIGVYDR